MEPKSIVGYEMVKERDMYMLYPIQLYLKPYTQQNRVGSSTDYEVLALSQQKNTNCSTCQETSTLKLINGISEYT